MKNSRNLRLATMLTTALAWSGINGLLAPRKAPRHRRNRTKSSAFRHRRNRAERFSSLSRNSRRLAVRQVCHVQRHKPSEVRIQSRNRKMRSVVRPDLQQAAVLRIPALQRLVNMPPQRQPVSHCLPPASCPHPDRSVRLARRSPPNSPSETTSSIARPSRGGHCRSAISSACRYSMR